MEDSPAAQASALKLTPHPILFTSFPDYSKSPSPYPRPPRKVHQRGTVFWAYPIGRSPQANARFESWMRGELRWRNRKLYQTEAAMDFRERVSRSIWPSKLGLSGYRILPARGILSFGGKVRLLLYASAGWEESVFCRRSPLSRCVFKRSICRGTFRLESNQKTAERLLRTTFQCG